MVNRYFLLVTFVVELFFIGNGCSGIPSDVELVHHEKVSETCQFSAYQLPNGLRVYLSVNHEDPIIYTQIGVRSGSMNDPSDKTGLAHYLEHLMFKGSTRIGTSNWEKEKILLEQIDSLYDEYCQSKDHKQREKIYEKIDVLSSQAAEYMIGNDYIKLLNQIGGMDVNAFTSNDRTVYLSSIPSNQVKNWLNLELERFKNPVFRGFHTELETVYGEMNMGQDDVKRRLYNAYAGALFENHPYGRPVIGYADHLRNPSPRKVMEFYRKWYVPENMAICLSGDFDPQQVLSLIKETFGQLPMATTPKINYPPVKVWNGEKVIELTAPQNEIASLGWRIDNPDQRAKDLLFLCAEIMNNGKAGLIDRHLIQPQKVGGAYCYSNNNNLFGTFNMTAIPLPGQSVDALIQMMDHELNLLKEGKFEEWLLEAIVDQCELNYNRQFRSNRSRVFLMMNCFIEQADLLTELTTVDRLRKYSKKDIQLFAKNVLSENRLRLIRRKGPLAEIEKLDKPKITPLPMQAENKSLYAHVFNPKPDYEIVPVFPNFKKQIAQGTVNGYDRVKILATHNSHDQDFSLDIKYQMGSLNDLRLSLMAYYINSVGTQDQSLMDLQCELFRLGGEFNVSVNEEFTTVHISGLQKNMSKLIDFSEKMMRFPAENPDVLKSLVSQIIESRQIEKTQFDNLFSALIAYGKYGSINPQTRVLTRDELNQITANELCQLSASLVQFPHEIHYYGPASIESLSSVIAQHHKDFPVVAKLPSAMFKYDESEVTENQVLCVDLPSKKQIHMALLSRANTFNIKNSAKRILFNECFSGSMSSLMFQVLRESKALCYSCSANYSMPKSLNEHHSFFSYISTQAEKMTEALFSLQSLIKDCPITQELFQMSQVALLKQRAIQRIPEKELIGSWKYLQRFSMPDNYYESLYNQLQNATLEEIMNFHKKEVCQPYSRLLIVGDLKRLDIGVLKKFGKVKVLSVDQVMPK